MGESWKPVEWQYQKNTAANAVRRIKGVRGVTNMILLQAARRACEIKRRFRMPSGATPKSMPIASLSKRRGSEVI